MVTTTLLQKIPEQEDINLLHIGVKCYASKVSFLGCEFWPTRPYSRRPELQECKSSRTNEEDFQVGNPLNVLALGLWP